MDFDEIPAARFFDLGISFHYLVFRLKSGEKEQLLVRGMNFLPYEPNVKQRIINQTVSELEGAGFREGVDELATNGGGTATLNPYYETVTLFGADADQGSEENREEVGELFKNAFPEHKVEWYSEGHAAEVERKEKEAKAKAKAAREAAKAKKAEAAKAAKSDEDEQEEAAEEPEADSEEETS